MARKNFLPRAGPIEKAGKGHVYVGMWRYFIAVSLDPAGWSVEGSIRLDSKIEGMKVQGDFAYLDLKRGGAPIVDLFDPTSLEAVGIHGVTSWVRGIQEDDMRVYRKEGSRMEAAVPR
jgi:hypothetical protein